VAKVIALYVPNTFRKPPQGVPEFERGKVVELCRQTKKLLSVVSLEVCHEFDRCFQS
jgi:hypothetical protein